MEPEGGIPQIGLRPGDEVKSWPTVTTMIRTPLVRARDGLYKDFEEALRRIGLSRAWLARKADTQAAAVRRLLGKRYGHNPTLSTVSKLAEALG